MSLIIDEMQLALEMAGGSVGFTALFLTGIVALWVGKYEKKSEAGALYWYAIISLLTVISPIYINIVKQYLPELYKSNMYLWILPVVPVVMYTGIKAASGLETRSKKVFFGISMFIILMLAALTSYSKSEVNMADNQYIESDKKDILEYISEELYKSGNEYCLIWAEDPVMEHARLVDGRIHTLYGKDLWQSGVADSITVSDNVIHFDADEKYNNQNAEIIVAYYAMQNAPYMLRELGRMAKEFECDYIILSEQSFENAEIPVPEEIGSYFLEYTDNTYLLYRYLNYHTAAESEE